MKFLKTTGVKIQQTQQAATATYWSEIFLNLTTTGVKILQAQEPNEISEYHNYWSKNTTNTATTAT